MSVHPTALILVLATIGLPAAHAGNTAAFAGGELGWLDGSVQSTLTRQQVRNELQSLRGNQAAHDGAQAVGGEVGLISMHHAYARVDGKWVCIDNIAHNPKPSLVMTDAERHMEYLGGN